MDYSALARTLSSRQSTHTVERATALARAGRIEEPELGSHLLSATVVGSRHYAVSVEEVDGKHFANCTCPSYLQMGPCKHILALVLWARDLLEVDPQAVDDLSHPIPRSPQQILLRTGMLRKVWRRRAHEIHFRAESERSQRLEQSARKPAELYVYELAPPDDLSDSEISISVRSAKAGRHGLPTRGRELHLGRIDLDGVPSPEDLRIVRRLRALRVEIETTSAYARASRDVTVRVDQADSLLRALARSGRCFLASDLNVAYRRPLRLESSGPWHVQIRREPTVDGVVPFRTVLARRSEVRAPSEVQAWIAPSFFVWERALCRLEVGAYLPWLRDAVRNGPILVPEGQLDLFAQELLEGGLAPELDLIEEHVIRDIAPRPSLQVVSAAGRGSPLGVVEFEYDDGTVPLHEPGQVVHSELHERVIVRDLAAEERAFAQLVRLPAVRPGKDPAEHDVRILKSELIETVAPLIEDGWRVQIEGRLIRAPGAFSGAVRSGVDWFDLDAGYDYGGEVVPLPTVLAAARKGRRFIELSDGTQALIPASFDDTWGVLADLADTEDGALRFARSQGWLLDMLLAARSGVEADQDFREHRARLAGFDGVKTMEVGPSFVGTLREYQAEGLGWFAFLREFGWGGCLADDMGLGKTIQVLAALDGLRVAGDLRGPTLIVAPRSVVFNWLDETARFTPELRALDYTGNGRAALRKRFGKFDLIVTTYGTLRRDAQALSEIEFDHVVLDEAQAIKNPRSQAFKAARLLKARHRLALTGTPVENRLSDLWTIFEFLNPGMLGRSATFRRIAADSVPAIQAVGSSTSEDNGLDEDDEAHREAARARERSLDGRRLLARALRPFLLRRTKEQVATDLPPRTEQVIRCELTKPQQKLYAKLRDHYRSLLLAGSEERRKAALKDQQQPMVVLEALLRLRQAACHADLVADGDVSARKSKSAGKSTSKSSPKTAERSGKLEALLPLLEEVTSGGHKALVFSQFTSFLALLRERLDADKTPYLYLDGQTKDRKELVHQFQTDPEQRLFLISLKAGGVGLNLTAADYVFLLDPWWNPAVEAQAIDRTHRIGQTRAVVAYRLISSNTVEEKVLALQAQKRELASSILTQDNALLSNLSRADLDLLLS